MGSLGVLVQQSRARGSSMQVSLRGPRRPIQAARFLLEGASGSGNAESQGSGGPKKERGRTSAAFFFAGSFSVKWSCGGAGVEGRGCGGGIRWAVLKIL